jgi:hypothetical protein
MLWGVRLSKPHPTTRYALYLPWARMEPWSILDRDDTPDGTAARPCHPGRAVFGVSAHAVGEAAAAPHQSSSVISCKHPESTAATATPAMLLHSLKSIDFGNGHTQQT